MAPQLSVQSANPSSLLRHSAFLPAPGEVQPVSPDPEDREPVRLLAIGSASGIDALIQALHLRGFAHVSEWSPLMFHSSGKLMRVLTRWVHHSPQK